YPFGDDIAATQAMQSLARTLRVPILIGTDQIVRGQETKYFNAAVLVRSDGSAGGVYRKMHLVPFGEYVPARHVFFFMSRIVQAVSDFSAGTTADVLPVDGHPTRAAIFYKIISRTRVPHSPGAGGEILKTPPNYSCWGATPAPYQPSARPSMPAIKTGRFLVRAPNPGIRGIVDPYGHVTAMT